MRSSNNYITQSQQTLIFFHIAKTAGTTLDVILKHNFPNNVTYSINYGDRPELLYQFKQSLEIERAKIRYFHAHMVPFGIHQYLSPARYIVLLRDPVERVISEYYFIRADKKHPLHDKLVFEDISLRDYVTNGIAPAAAHNGQTRLLSGIEGVDWATGAGPISQDTLKISLNNLQKHFSLVGFTEKFDESLILLKQILGWKNTDLFYQRRRVNVHRPPKQAISKEDIKLIEECNTLDIKLYQTALQQFDQTVASQGASFTMELEALRIWNKIYNRLYKYRRLVTPVKQMMLGTRRNK